MKNISLKCPKCDANIEDDNKISFCKYCGTRLSLKCPNCHADLKDGDKISFCKYCGKRLLIDDEAHNMKIAYKKDVEVSYRKEDIARIKENERKEKIKMKELEMEEKKRKSDKSTTIGAVVFLIVLFILMFIMAEKEKAAEVEHGAQLSRATNEIYIASTNSDYDSALIKANILYYQ